MCCTCVANACRCPDRTTYRDTYAAYRHRYAANGDTAAADCDAGAAHVYSGSHGDTRTSNRYTCTHCDLDTQAYHGDTACDGYV